MSVQARLRGSAARRGALLAIATAAALSVSSPAAASGPHIIRELVPGPGGVGEFSNYFDGVVGSTAIFTTDPGLGQGQEPWRTDGTKHGTSLLKNINPGTQDSGVSRMVTLGKLGFFDALDSDFGAELWQTNGSSNGTHLVKDINPSGADSNADPWATMGGKLFFSASDGSLGGDHGNELWTTTGKPGGTKLVKDIAPGPTNDSGINKLASIGSKVLFIANDDSGKGLQLFVSDGTSHGTHLVKVINQDGSSGGIEFYPGAGPLPAVIGHTYYFEADDGPAGGHGFELWKSDGTATGTKLVKDINPGTDGTGIQWLKAVGSRLFFSAQTAKGAELWISDGTPGGTHMVKDINKGSGSSYPYLLGAIGRTIYFDADSGTGKGSELWKSDGTAHGTTMVKDIQPGPGGSSAIDGVVIGKTLLFSADTTAKGREVWRTDGTAAGTRIIADLAHGPADADPDAMGRLGTHLFFIADDGVHGREPWIYTP